MSKTIKEKKYYRVSNTNKDYNGLLDVPPSNKYELYTDMESEIEQKKQQAYADMHEY